MSSRSELRLDYCDANAARYAVEKWHYSGTLPCPPMITIGVWEDRRFIGCVIYARGATKDLLTPYALKQTEGCELVRVALTKHRTPVTRIIAVSLKLLVKKSPGLKLVVSFADPFHDHHGGIYQGGGWIYNGQTTADKMYLDAKGKMHHSRTVSSSGVKKMFGKLRRVPKFEECKAIKIPGKHRYLMPLCDDVRKRIQPLALPYPKRA